jgi:peptidyl-prolyl cis-trans isomerase C
MHSKKQRLSALFILFCFSFVVMGGLFAEEKEAKQIGKPDDVLAEISDKKIDRKMFEAEIEKLTSANPQAGAFFAKPEGREKFLNQLAEVFTLEKQAKKLGLDKGEKFNADCREMAVGMLAGKHFQGIVDKVVVSDEELKKFYNENQDNFKEPAEYSLFQISVETPQKAADLKKELDAGKSFIEAAKKDSVDSFKDAGGNRGLVSEKDLNPAVAAIIGELKKDELSKPVRTGEKEYQLIKYTDKKDGKIKDFDSVQAIIKQELGSTKQREAYEATMEGLKKELGYELNKDSVELLRKPELSKEDLAKTLMKVGGEEMKVEAIAEELEQIPPFIRPQLLNGQGLDDFIKQFAYRNLAVKYAEKNYDALAKTSPDVLEDVSRRTAIKYLLDKEIGNIKVEDAAVKEYYDKNTAEFSSPAQLRAHHILVKEEKDAKEILEQLKKDPTQFEKIASEKSTCPSGKKGGGDLGMFSEGQMVPEFDKACQEAEVGKLVGPVKTQFGFHIIRVDEKQAAGAKKFEEVQDAIRAKLLPQKQKEAFETLIAKLKKEFTVKIYTEKL